MATKLALNPITWKLDLVAKPWLNQGDFQYNNNGNFEWDALLSTDGLNVYIWQTVTAWTTEDTVFDLWWFQTMLGKARPRKTINFDLRPRQYNNDFNLKMPPVYDWFGWVPLLPFFQRSKTPDDYEWIPFSFIIPNDYEKGTPLFWQLHFSTRPDDLSPHIPWSVAFFISYTWATTPRDCRITTFTPYENLIKSCVNGVEIDSTYRTSISTEQDNDLDILGWYLSMRAWDIIEWKICRQYTDRFDDFADPVIPLYLSIQYISDRLWLAADGRPS